MKAIDYYNDIVKEFEITAELTVEEPNKVMYLREQRDQQRAIINRLVFDMATAKAHEDAAKDAAMKDAHRKKYDDYKNDLRQLLGALKINLQLLESLSEASSSPTK